jgi:hypothetical protein
MPREAIAGRHLARLPRSGIELICLSYVNPGATQHAHRIVRRLRQHFGREIRIMVGMWTVKSSEAQPEVLEATGADLVAASLWQAVRQIQGSFESEKPAAPLGSASRRIARSRAHA